MSAAAAGVQGRNIVRQLFGCRARTAGAAILAFNTHSWRAGRATFSMEVASRPLAGRVACANYSLEGARQLANQAGCRKDNNMEGVSLAHRGSGTSVTVTWLAAS